MIIKNAAPEQFQAVRAFYHSLIDGISGAPYGAGWMKDIYPAPEFLEDSIRDGNLWIAEENGEIIGAMVINHECNDGYRKFQWPTEAEENEVTVIHALGVHPSHGGQGYAKRMVRFAIDLAKKNRQKVIRLDVLKGNLPAEKLYASMGFSYLHTLPMFYEDTGWTDYELYEYKIPEKPQALYELRHELHRHPELSLHEEWTKEHLIDWICMHTSFTIHRLERGFLAIKEPEEDAGQGAIAFRADYDALPIAESEELPYHSLNAGVSHKCGHDGHSAALCGLALALEGKKLKRRVVLIFQGAEEIGQGGESCAAALEGLDVKEVYAFHNRSGYPEGTVVVKRGVTQCASEGLRVSFSGKASHASAPEEGVNPAAAAAELVLYTNELQKMEWTGLVMATVVHVRVGSPDFGISPGDGLVCLTLRAEHEREMLDAENAILEKARELGNAYGLGISFERQDVFPETVNDAVCAKKVAEAARKMGLDCRKTEEVWRASEDFGYYTKKIPGAMFYIGNGESHPALHTAEYDFNDRIIETAVSMFEALALKV